VANYPVEKNSHIAIFAGTQSGIIAIFLKTCSISISERFTFWNRNKPDTEILLFFLYRGVKKMSDHGWDPLKGYSHVGVKIHLF
jgi:hypothetical protein